jgi:hypothetical protein
MSKILKTVLKPNGTRTVTINLDPNEELMVIDNGYYYKLGGQINGFHKMNYILLSLKLCLDDILNLFKSRRYLCGT